MTKKDLSTLFDRKSKTLYPSGFLTVRVSEDPDQD